MEKRRKASKAEMHPKIRKALCATPKQVNSFITHLNLVLKLIFGLNSDISQYGDGTKPNGCKDIFVIAHLLLARVSFRGWHD